LAILNRGKEKGQGKKKNSLEQGIQDSKEIPKFKQNPNLILID